MLDELYMMLFKKMTRQTRKQMTLMTHQIYQETGLTGLQDILRMLCEMILYQNDPQQQKMLFLNLQEVETSVLFK